MSATLRWIVERRLLTLAGFGVILLGAFVPWPSLAIAAVVIVLGAVLLAVQIPIAMRDATEQLDGADEPEEQWQAPAYPRYQPEPSPQVAAPVPVWQPSNISQFQETAPNQQPAPSHVPEPSPRIYAPAPQWQPTNIPHSPEAQPAEEARPGQVSAPSRRMYEPVPVWQPTNLPQSTDAEPSPQPGPSRRLDEPAAPWRPQNIPQYRPEP